MRCKACNSIMEYSTREVDGVEIVEDLCYNCRSKVYDEYNDHWGNSKETRYLGNGNYQHMVLILDDDK